MDDAANEAIVANEAADSDDEANGVLDNQLAELEKLDAANKAIVSNKMMPSSPMRSTRLIRLSRLLMPLKPLP